MVSSSRYAGLVCVAIFSISLISCSFFSNSFLFFVLCANAVQLPMTTVHVIMAISAAVLMIDTGTKIGIKL